MGDHIAPPPLDRWRCRLRDAVGARYGLEPGDIRDAERPPFAEGTFPDHQSRDAGLHPENKKGGGAGFPRKTTRPDFYVGFADHHDDVGGTYPVWMGGTVPRDLFQGVCAFRPLKIMGEAENNRRVCWARF